MHIFEYRTSKQIKTYPFQKKYFNEKGQRTYIHVFVEIVENATSEMKSSVSEEKCLQNNKNVVWTDIKG